MQCDGIPILHVEKNKLSFLHGFFVRNGTGLIHVFREHYIFIRRVSVEMGIFGL